MTSLWPLATPLSIELCQVTFSASVLRGIVCHIPLTDSSSGARNSRGTPPKMVNKDNFSTFLPKKNSKKKCHAHFFQNFFGGQKSATPTFPRNFFLPQKSATPTFFLEIFSSLQGHVGLDRGVDSAHAECVGVSVVIDSVLLLLWTL